MCFSLLLFLSLIKGVFCGEFRINSAAEFLEFSANVNSGTNFNGTTVFLDSDIVFTDELLQEFEPIGNSSRCFVGTFDGQGHTISNLEMKSTLGYVGLFGYSMGTTIRNVVMDSSCSVVSSALSGSPCVGGIIGYCQLNKNPCNIENTVNMGRVSFNGDTSSNLRIGGIAGYFYFQSYEVRLRNCANYGAVVHAGTSGITYIGGIVGYSSGSSSEIISIQNCLNHGTLSNNNEIPSDQYIGGISGYTDHTTIENCVSAGKITSKYSSGYIGGIIGCAWYSEISHCYWSKDVKESAYGSKDSSSLSGSSSFDSTSFELSESVSVGTYTGTSLLDALNAFVAYYQPRDYSHWALNRNSNTVAFTINGRTNPITLNSQIILLPSLASEGRLWFDGWYTDASCESPLESFEITSAKELYGKWGENTNSYIITFDTRGGTPIEPIVVQYLSVVLLPKSTERDNCTIAWWETGYGESVPWNFTVPAHNLTLRAVWSCTRLNSAADLVDLSKVVNSGTTYSGTTVFLDSDIDFTDELSQQFEPIGKNLYGKHFCGTFDGQGHTISNLAIKSSSRYSGLFGYSNGATIRNVVMDSTCSVVSSFESTSENPIIGGVIGCCNSNSRSCNIESIVNMGIVIFNGVTNNLILYLGGITGYFYFQSHEVRLRNCASYGTVTHAGRSGVTYIGGVIGYSQVSSSPRMISIQNCLNYGTITNNNAKSNNQYVGGIAGATYCTAIENCVSAGKIVPKVTGGVYIGAIVGYAYLTTSITHCSWTSEAGNDAVGKEAGSPEVTDSCLVAIPNVTTISELNRYTEGYSWNKWLLNTNNASITFRVGGCKGFALDSQIILLPGPTDNSERTFRGWFWDEAFSSPFTVIEVEADTTLYGMFCRPNYTVTLDVNGGDELESRTMDAFCNETYGWLPVPTRTGHSFTGWFTRISGGVKVESGDRVRSFSNHTLYARWAINNYTVTFVFGNGMKDENRSFSFNASIEYPEDPTKEGYTFNGWDNYTSMMPAQDLVIKAQWSINNYTVTFVFNNGMSDENRTFAFDAPIEYPVNLTREGYTFIRWDNYAARMPARDITVIAQWARNDGGSSLSTSVVVGIIILVAVVIGAVLIALFFVLRRRDRNRYRDMRYHIGEPLIGEADKSRYESHRFVAMSINETEGFVAEEDRESALSDLYPQDYTRPTMRDALLDAGLTDEYAEVICHACEKAAHDIVERENLPEGFTEEDAAAIALYTYDFGAEDFENNPYRIINKSIASGNYNSLQQASGLLYLVMSALRKLPRVTGRTLYRGVRGKVDLDDGYYYNGNVITWPALSSTSPNMDTTKKFLAKGTASGCAAGTLFIIEDGWGYNTRPYSLFPTETEILLEPERRFKVTAIIQGDGLTFINLQMLDTPLSNPEVFGYGKK